MAYGLISYKSQNKQCWTILDQTSGLTPMYSIIYSVLKLSKRSTSTQRRHMTAICQFYEYIYLKHNDSFDGFFELNGLRGVIFELDGFSSYLDSGKKGVNIISLGHSSVDVTTGRIRISDVVTFLSFLNNRYTSSRYDNSMVPKRLASEQTAIKFLLKDKKEDLTESSSRKGAAAISEEYKSLTPYQCTAFLKVIYPSTPENHNKLNPFSSISVSFRNYLICTLALEYGLRRGEINLLETDSFKPSIHNIDGKTTYYITVTNCDDEETVEGSIKTEYSHRTLKITEQHYNYLCAYVNNFRGNSDSSILFLSTQEPKPITLRMFNKIFQVLTKAIHQNFTEIANHKSIEYVASFHPHKLRHTWAVAQLYHMVDEQKMSITDAKDLLRINGGWSIKSNMPDHYGRRFLADKANAANLRHIMQGEESC